MYFKVLMFSCYRLQNCVYEIPHLHHRTDNETHGISELEHKPLYICIKISI